MEYEEGGKVLENKSQEGNENDETIPHRKWQLSHSNYTSNLIVFKPFKVDLFDTKIKRGSYLIMTLGINPRFVWIFWIFYFLTFFIHLLHYSYAIYETDIQSSNIDLAKLASAVATKLKGVVGNALTSFTSSTGVGSAWGAFTSSWGGGGSSNLTSNEIRKWKDDHNITFKKDHEKINEFTSFYDDRRKVENIFYTFVFL